MAVVAGIKIKTKLAPKGRVTSQAFVKMLKRTIVQNGTMLKQ